MKRSRLHVVGVAFAFAMMTLWHASRGLQFQHATLNKSEDIANIRIEWNASFSASGTWLTPDPNAVTPTSSSSLGRIVYQYPVQLITLDNQSVPPINRTASFNTSFSFQIITTAPYGMCGSGMAFFISTSEQPPENSVAGTLGLISYPATQAVSDQFFAVEFDTYLTPEFEDPSASHIGIDINSLNSSNITDTSPKSSSFYPELYLYDNYAFTAWIEYNASSHLIQVWMTNSTTRPLEPCLQLQYDLSSVFQDSMYVGFSGTNELDEGSSMEGFAILSWNFSSDDLTSVVSPAPLLNSVSNCKSSCGKNKSKLPLHLALPGVFITVAVCGVLVWFTIRRLRRKAKSRPGNDSNNVSNIELAASASAMPRYSYRELRKATHGFDDKDKVGEGGFSSVYRGSLADGSTVAVKKLKEGGLRRESDFSSEIRIISNIRHRNLLQLQGWCYERGEALLVYKYMAKGSLDTYLFGRKKGSLQSETRFRILLGVAAALEYLHGGLGDCVLHRDVKAANVLLTEDFEAMLGDFGLARLISHNQAVTMTAAGTPGYVAPEVVYTGRATDKADVYSFGVLALEVACGRAAMDGSLQPQEMRLVNWVWLLHQSNKLIEALDPSIYEEAASMDMRALEVQQQWRCVLHVALMCCHTSPESRPTMRQVTQALQDTMLMPLPTTMPTYPRSPDKPIYCSNPDAVFASGSSTSTGLSPSVSALISEIYGSTATSAVTTLGRPAASSAAPSATKLR